MEVSPCAKPIIIAQFSLVIFHIQYWELATFGMFRCAWRYPYEWIKS